MGSDGVEAAKPKVLLELRPALEGFSGIPQEARLLFRGLRQLDAYDIQGMIQTSHDTLERGVPLRRRWYQPATIPASEKYNLLSRVIVSMTESGGRVSRLLRGSRNIVIAIGMAILPMLGLGRVKLSGFDPRLFEDFIWQALFSKSLPSSDFKNVTSAQFTICSRPWHVMHLIGLNTRRVFRNARYCELDTQGFDIFIAQTPYPARIRSGTSLVVRYHDAIPIFLPHTIPNKSMHQATHFHALSSNVRNGAHFACVSETTRQSLLAVFPEVADRAVTIHDLLSPSYFLENSDSRRAPDIVRSRLLGRDIDAVKLELSPKFLSIREQEQFYRRVLDEKSFRYLMVVSSIEPRKNHARLIAAWQRLLVTDPQMKLVIVGSLGWDYGPLLKSLRTWIDRGSIFLLNAVPAPDLRVLYRHAVATVCPSVSEGFDFSGVESMRSGGTVVASDIDVHREIYDDAAEYFDPYSTPSLLNALIRVTSDPGATALRARLANRGAEVASRYLPEKILPQWDAFLRRVSESEGRSVLVVPAASAISEYPVN